MGGEGDDIAFMPEKGRWHHQLNGHEFEQALGNSKGQGSLVCCSPWGHKELNMTEQLNRTELSYVTVSKAVPCSFPPVTKALSTFDKDLILNHTIELNS